MHTDDSPLLSEHGGLRMLPEPPRLGTLVLLCALAALAWLMVGGCADTARPTALPAGVKLTDGVPITNGCLVEAIHAYQELVKAGVPAQVLAIGYRAGGQNNGHAMTSYAWKDQWSGVERWAWDARNQSQPIVSRIDDAMGVAREMFAEPTKAHVMTIPRADQP